MINRHCDAVSQVESSLPGLIGKTAGRAAALPLEREFLSFAQTLTNIFSLHSTCTSSIFGLKSACTLQLSMQNSLLQRIRIRRRLPATAQHSGGQAPAAESRPNQPLTRILITGGDGPPRRSIVPDQGVHEDGI